MLKSVTDKINPPVSETETGGFLYLILHSNLLTRNKRVTGKASAVKLFFMHIHRRNLVIFVGGVVIYSLVRITARSIKGYFVFPFCHLTTAPLLVNRALNLEKLAYAFVFRVPRNRVHFGKGNPYKAGLGGKVARQSQSSHSSAVGFKGKLI